MALRISPRLVAWLMYVVYKPWCATLRLTEENRALLDERNAAGQPTVLCLWHNELFTLIHVKRQLKLMTIASKSKDGEYIAGVLEHLGFAVARGSSSRGAVSALLASARLMRKGYSPAVTVDGPRGPRHKVKDGAIFLAHTTKAPIMAARAYCERVIRFNSWDKFEIPVPFSKVRVVFSAPYTVERAELDEDALAEERIRLETVLEHLGRQEEHCSQSMPDHTEEQA